MRKTILGFLLFLALLMIQQGHAADESANPPVEQEHSIKTNEPRTMLEEIRDKEAVSDDRFAKEFGNMLFVLGAILSVIFIGSWFLKRFLNTKVLQGNSSSPIKILERRALSPKAAIYLVEILGKKVALTESASGITNLGAFKDIDTNDNPSNVPVSNPNKPFNKIYDDTLKTEK